MWTSKIVETRCPQCGGELWLTQAMRAKELGTYSIAGAQAKFVMQATPELNCQGTWNAPLGQSMDPSCGYRLTGWIDENGDAVFQP